MDNLETSAQDRLASLAKGAVGACPFVGPIVAEVVGSLIPNQRIDRVVEFLRHLDAEVRRIDVRLEQFENNMRTAEGVDLMEEGLTQAARSISQGRKENLARLIGRSLSAEALKYEESRKLLNLYRDLTDPEVIWLLFYSLSPTLGGGSQHDLLRKHGNVLNSISRDLSSSQEQVDRGALQDSYKNTLLRYGLVELDGASHQITSLGRLLVRYIQE